MDVASAVARGDHKSASARPDLLEELATDDTISGFQVIIPIETACSMKNGVVSPHGTDD